MSEVTEVAKVDMLDQAKANMVEALTNMLNMAVGGAERAGTMLAQEVPDVVVQLLTWHAVSYAINVVVFTTLLLVGLWIIKKIKVVWSIAKPELKNERNFKWQWDSYRGEYRTTDNWQLIIVVMSIISFIILSVSLYHIIYNLKMVLYIWVAPKVYLIEYGVDLVRKMM